MYLRDHRKLIDRTTAFGGMPRRRLLQGAAALSLAAILRPTLVLAKQPRQLGPFSDWSEPVWLGLNVNSTSDDYHPAISKDGLSLYISSFRPGGVNEQNSSGLAEIWVSQRDELDEPWGPAQNLGSPINLLGSRSDAPNLTPDGHWLFFGSDRPGGFGRFDLWASWREDPDDDFAWEAPVNLGPRINTSGGEDSAVYFKDRETGITSLYFTSQNRPGNVGDFDIYVSELEEDGKFGPGALVRELSGLYRDTRMAIRSDGLEMIFTSNRPLVSPGPTGPLNLWVSTRASTLDPWSTPIKLGPQINTVYNDRGPALSFDGKTLYFASGRAPGDPVSNDLWMATRTKLHRDDDEDDRRQTARARDDR
jgi:hypothetical protein